MRNIRTTAWVEPAWLREAVACHYRLHPSAPAVKKRIHLYLCTWRCPYVVPTPRRSNYGRNASINQWKTQYASSQHAFYVYLYKHCSDTFAVTL